MDDMCNHTALAELLDGTGTQRRASLHVLNTCDVDAVIPAAWLRAYWWTVGLLSTHVPLSECDAYSEGAASMGRLRHS